MSLVKHDQTYKEHLVREFIRWRQSMYRYVITLVLQFLRRHLHDGDAPVGEFVDELRAARAGDLGSRRSCMGFSQWTRRYS